MEKQEKEKIESGNSSLVLPIICPKCGEQIELSIDFSLLPPKKIENKDATTEEN